MKRIGDAVVLEDHAAEDGRDRRLDERPHVDVALGAEDREQQIDRRAVRPDRRPAAVELLDDDRHGRSSREHQPAVFGLGHEFLDVVVDLVDRLGHAGVGRLAAQPSNGQGVERALHVELLGEVEHLVERRHRSRLGLRRDALAGRFSR